MYSIFVMPHRLCSSHATLLVYCSQFLSASNGVITHPRGNDYPPKVVLPSFGLSWYKYNGSFWAYRGASEQQSASRLLETAHEWLRDLKVNHPDYQFFSSNGAYRRWCSWEIACWACLFMRRASKHPYYWMQRLAGHAYNTGFSILFVFRGRRT